MHKNYLVYLTSLLLFLFAGCEDHSSQTTEKKDRGPLDIGQSVYQSIETYTQQSQNGPAKVKTLQSPCSLCQAEYDRQGALCHTHKDTLVVAMNNLFAGKDTTKLSRAGTPDPELYRTLYDLVRDNTLPQFTDALSMFLQEMGSDTATVEAVSAFVNTRCGTDFRSVVEMARKMFNYQKSPDVCKAIARIVQNNPEFLKQVFSMLSEGLSSLPETGPEMEPMAKLLAALATELSVSNDLLGSPAWLARLDRNSNPKVQGSGASMPAPFVDKDADDICDVNAEGKPIDKNGNVLEIPAFSTRPYYDSEGLLLLTRDSSGRALMLDGNPAFVYYNAKKTVLGVVLYSIAEAVERGMVKDGFMFAKISLLPKKTYSDSQGSYEGYSNESELVKAGVGALNLLKLEQTRHLLIGSAMLFEQNPAGAEAFLLGLCKLFCMLRDEELQNPEQLGNRMVEIIQSGSIPEILVGFEAMEKIVVPESGMPNLTILFIYWLSGNIEAIAGDAVWPLRLSLQAVKAGYPNDPKLADRLFANAMQWLCGSMQSRDERKLAQIVPILLRLFLQEIAVDTEVKVEAMKTGLKSVIASRCLAAWIRCHDTLINSPELKTIEEMLVAFVTPQSDPEQEVYSELCKVAVGALEYRHELQPKIKLLKMIGKFLHPERPMIMKMMEAIGRFLAVDKSFAIVNALRIACSKSLKHGIAPVFVFGHASIDVMRVDGGCPMHNQHVTPDDVRKMMGSIIAFLHSQDGLLQRLYRVIRNHQE
jgi:hypothetical protein